MTYFYSHLFAIEPSARAMFPPAMDAQRTRFYQALRRVVLSSDNAGQADRLPGRAGAGSSQIRRPEGAFRRCWPGTRGHLAAVRAQAWTDAGRLPGKTCSARRPAYDRRGRTGRRTGTAWWLAEIVAHEARSADLAVLTLQPSQPLPYLPGQHVSVQTPRWPRLWRNYSIANAPREDGTLTVHVRAVPGGLVSAALGASRGGRRHAAAGGARRFDDRGH